MPRHIVICFHDFPIGGTERVAIDLARRWMALGWRVTILCGTEAGPQRALVDPTVAVVSLDPPLPRSPVSRLALARRMAERLPGLAPDHIAKRPAQSRAQHQHQACQACLRICVQADHKKAGGRQHQ